MSSFIHADLDALVRLSAKARGFSFLPRQPIHSILAGRHASRLRGRGLNFEEIRNYLPGDDVRTMDWKVTARTRSPHIRVYTEERDRPVLFIVDQRSSMFFGSRRTMKSVTACEVAALGAWRVLKQGDRVGALIFNDREVINIQPHRSRTRVRQMLGSMVEMNHQLNGNSPPANPEKFNEVLKQALQMAKHDYLICVISDAYGMNPETKRLLTLLSAHNDVINAFIYDPLEANLPDAGKLTMAEGNKQMEVDTGSKKIRSAFAREFNERLNRIQSISRGRSIPVLPIETSRPVPEQVRDLMGASTGQGRKGNHGR
ncbi:DUF58 domain-containing protein [Verrucomicrobiaceae bacterium N1E253]|uniref:DUF58 domain-containing protein n=1 Tax=Oceaniferula marina TaxID=2748318 RepID=A0A851GLX7_9BACT|nr:DUF58 domain-containing protein [Oceaniferula marina]NWK55134.1 DUF58 domain-containing protein [Oceaniferula marina]